MIVQYKSKFVKRGVFQENFRERSIIRLMRILVVEDEHKLAAAIKKGLEQEGFAVDLAYDGLEGFDLAVGEEYDLIILDLMLPGMEGITFCRRLREEEKIQTPILILTALGQTEDKVKGLNAGADDYLVKPFAFAELLARIRALTRRPKESLPTVLKAQDLVLDTVKREVWRGGKIINLTKTEYALLEYLLRQKEKVVSKEQIIAHVWSYEADILPNTVEAFVGRLRKKLGKPEIIQTVRGFGYKVI